MPPKKKKPNDQTKQDIKTTEKQSLVSEDDSWLKEAEKLDFEDNKNLLPPLESKPPKTKVIETKSTETKTQNTVAVATNSTPKKKKTTKKEESTAPKNEPVLVPSEKYRETVGEWIQDFDFLERNEIFHSEFFVLEINRLKTKYLYEEQRKENPFTALPHTEVQKALTSLTPTLQHVIELRRAAELKEYFATEFADGFEYEWARTLILQAITLRKHLYSLLSPSSGQTKLSDDSGEDAYAQLTHIEKDWEQLVDLCLLGEPSIDPTEGGILKTLELLDSTEALVPHSLSTARSPFMLKLWENRVLKILRLFEAQKKQGTASAIVEQFFVPAIQKIPYYLDRRNEVLSQLWEIILALFKEESTVSGSGVQTISFPQFLQRLHDFFLNRLGGEDVPAAVCEAFPLFPDVCEQLTLLALEQKDWVKAQEYAIEEMTAFLELDEEEQVTKKMLAAWERVFRCLRTLKTKSSDQFFLLKDLLQEIAVYNNETLKTRIQRVMETIGHQREVRYILHYSDQLRRCARLFFGASYEEFAQLLDETGLLDEILSNVSAAEGSQEELLNELRGLAELNYDFHFELKKLKEVSKALKLLSDALEILRLTDPPSLQHFKVNISPLVLRTFDAAVACTAELSLSPEVTARTLMRGWRSCYDNRPKYFPASHPSLVRLWEGLEGVKEFQRDLLEGMYRAFAVDKQRMMAEHLEQMHFPHKEGWVTFRTAKTWQRRWVSLRDTALYWFKTPKGLRPRGMLSLSDCEILLSVPTDVLTLVPHERRDSVFTLVTPYREYSLYCDSEEERDEWVSALTSREKEREGGEIRSLEQQMNFELLAQHPLIIPVLVSLGTLWEGNEFTEEALVLYIQGLELTAPTGDLEMIGKLWESVYSLLLKTKNIYEILEFLEEEHDRWLANGLSGDHVLFRLITQSLSKIRTEEDLKLRYLYQIRKFKEISEDIFPSRIYYLNRIYALMFLQNNSLTEAVALTKDSLDLLKRHIDADELIGYYHTNTWHLLVDLFLSLAKDKERGGDYYGARLMLQSAFADLPRKLDPFNLRLNRLIDEIYYLYNVDPETQPDPQTALTDTAAFSWMHHLYLDYDVALGAVYPSEALANRSTVLNYKPPPERDLLHSRADDFRRLIQQYPHMMNLCTKLSKDYYLSHQLELALHMSRHSLHIMAASMATRHREIAAQWKFAKKCFLAQRHSNLEFGRFIEEELLIASVFLHPTHPHMERLQQDLDQLQSKMALYEKYLPASAFYVCYLALLGALVGLSLEYGSSLVQWLRGYGTVWLGMGLLHLEWLLLAVAMTTLSWPAVPGDATHRAASLIQRSEEIKEVGLVLAVKHSTRDALVAALRGALHVFPPEQIFVCHYGNGPTPKDPMVRDICGKMTEEYRLQHRLPPSSPAIHYLWCPEKNYLLAVWWTTKYYCKYRYTMVIDGKVRLPRDLIIPMHHFEDPQVKALTFTLGAHNLYTNTGEAQYVTFWQDLELKVEGFVRMYQSYLGSVLEPYTSVSLWDRTTLLEVLWKHNTMPRGQDLQTGLILQKLNRNLKIIAAGNINVPVAVPDHWACRHLFKCKCEGNGEGNLIGRRVKSPTVLPLRFLWQVFTVMMFYWKRTTLFLKPLLLLQAVDVFLLDWIRLPLWGFLLYLHTYDFIWVNIAFLGVQEVLLLVFHFWVLRRRPDQQHPLLISLSYPVYKWVTWLFRFCAVWFNLLYYSPFIRNALEVGERQDLPLDPVSLKKLQKLVEEDDTKSDNVPVPEVLLQKDSHEWETVVKLIYKEAEVSPPLSHWFLSCVSQLVWKKKSPRKKVLLSSKVMEHQSIFNRTKDFFYVPTDPIVPQSFVTCLNAMTFLAKKKRCLGKDFSKAAKILKWLWIEERLGEQVSNSSRLSNFLGEYAHRCVHGITLVDFVALVKGVMIPTLMHMDLSSQLKTQLLHVQPVLLETEKDQKERGEWGLRTLSFTSSKGSEERLIVRKYHPSQVKGLVTNRLPFVVFVPFPARVGGPLEAFRPSVSHGGLLCDGTEGTVLLLLPSPAPELLPRLAAVVELLELPKDLFPSLLLLQPDASTKPLSWEDLSKLARKFFTQKEEKRKLEKAPEVQESQVTEIIPGGKSASVPEGTISSSGFWLLPVLDIVEGPVLLLDEEDKQLDSTVYFEPFVKLLGSDYRVSTHAGELLKTKIMTYNVAARSLGGLSAVSGTGETPRPPPPFRVLTLRCVTFDNRKEFQFFTFASVEMEWVLLDYLWYVVHKKALAIQQEEEEQRKLQEAVELIRLQEKERLLKPSPGAFDLPSQEEFDFLNEPEKFNNAFPEL